MKKLLNLTALLLACLTLVLCFAACNDKDKDSKAASTTSLTEDDGSIKKEGLWENAIYLKDTTIGEGDTTFNVVISIDKQSITLTVKTNAETVGAALLENEVISGEEGAYGLYIKKVNGVTADYDKDKAYWAFYVDGEYATSGVDSTKIDSSVTYKLEYAK